MMLLRQNGNSSTYANTNLRHIISAGVMPAVISMLLAANVEPQRHAVISANICQIICVCNVQNIILDMGVNNMPDVGVNIKSCFFSKTALYNIDDILKVKSLNHHFLLRIIQPPLHADP